MIPAPSHVWLVVESVDMRAGIDGLSQRIQNTLGRSPCDGRKAKQKQNKKAKQKTKTNKTKEEQKKNKRTPTLFT